VAGAKAGRRTDYCRDSTDADPVEGSDVLEVDQGLHFSDPAGAAAQRHPQFAWSSLQLSPWLIFEA